MNYKDELIKAMDLVASKENTFIIGQNVKYGGTSMFHTFKHLPKEKMIELPVIEETQMGMSIGLALAGQIPVTIYPRWNFLILAANQVVNHLDKMKCHVIIRVGVGSEKPLHPGPQHVGDFTQAFREMTSNTVIETLDEAAQIVPAYRAALEWNGPSILVEKADMY